MAQKGWAARCLAAAFALRLAAGDCPATGASLQAQSILGAVKGQGTLQLAGSELTYPTFLNGTSILLQQQGPDGTGMWIECVYDAYIDFNASSFTMWTARPGMGGSDGKPYWRKWTLTLNPGGTTLGFQFLPNATSTSGAQFGQLSGFAALPARSVMPTGCATPSSLFALSYLDAIAMNGVTPEGYAFEFRRNFLGIPVNYTGVMPGFLAACVADADLLGGDRQSYQVKLYYNLEQCVFVRPIYRNGLVAWFNSTCLSDVSNAKFADVATAAGITPQYASASFLNPPANDPVPVPTPNPSVQAPPMVPTKVDVTTFSVVFTQSGGSTSVVGNPEIMSDPCVLASVRQQYATALGVPMSRVMITSVTLSSGVSVAVAPGSVSNIATGTCSQVTTSRRALGAAGGSGSATLRSSTGSARRLQSATSSVGAQVVNYVNSAAVANVGQLTSLSTMLLNVATAKGQQGLSQNQFQASTSPSVGVQSGVLLYLPATAPARINPYVPKPVIDSWHNQARFGGGSNSFVAAAFTSGDPINNSYVKGIAFPAATLIAFGVLILLVYTLTYLIACCRCCKGDRCRRDRSIYQHGCKRCCTPWLTMLIFALAAGGVVLAGLAYSPGFPQGVSSLQSALNQLTGQLSTSATLLTSTSPISPPYQGVNATGQAFTLPYSMATALSYAQANAAVLQAQAQAAPGTPQAVLDMLKATSTGLASASTAINSASQPLTDASNTLQSTFNGLPLNTIRQAVALASYIVLAVVAGFVIIQALFAQCSNRCASCTFKVLVFPVIFLSALVAVLAGIFYTVGLAGSDVCYSPNSVLALYVGQGTSMADNTLQYYLNCGVDPFRPVAGTALQQVLDGVAQVVSAQQQVLALSSQASSIPNSGVWNNGTYMATLVDNMNLASNAIQAVYQDQVSCMPVDAVFSQLWDGICNGSIVSGIMTSQLLVAAAAILAVMLGIGVDVCLFHPGARKAWLNGDEESPKVDPVPALAVPAASAPFSSGGFLPPASAASYASGPKSAAAQAAQLQYANPKAHGAMRSPPMGAPASVHSAI